jgi:transposase
MSLSLQTIDGKYCYIKESTSFRDELGRPRNHKVSVGKYDLETGIPTFNISYLVEMRDKGNNIYLKGQTYNPNDLIKSCIKSNINTQKINTVDKPDLFDPNVKNQDDCVQNLETFENRTILHAHETSKIFGVFYFLVNIANKIGLLDILEKSIPDYWEQIFTLVMYNLNISDAFSKCCKWADDNFTFDNIGSMSSQSISNLLYVLSETERNNFYNLWSALIVEDEYINIDITALSTYSKKSYLAEDGYQKQKTTKPSKQINLCLLFGQKSFTPVYQTLYNGSLHDSKTLYITVSRFLHIIGKKKCLFVMDRGFFSKANLAALDNDGYKYLFAVPFTNNWVKDLVDQYRTTIEDPLNKIETADTEKEIYGIHKQINFSSENIGVHTHIYFNFKTYSEQKNKLFNKILEVKKLLINGDDIKNYEYFIERYLVIKKSKGGYQPKDIKTNKESVNNALRYTGWFIFASNEIDNAQKAYDVYHNRDMVEKGFFKYKNVMNLERLEVHSDVRANNKIFVIFLSLIMDRYVTSFIKNNKILRRYVNLEGILNCMSTIKSSYNNKGDHIVGPITSAQKKIFKEFDIEIPEIICKWDKYDF